MIKEIQGESYLYLICQKVEQPIGVFYITSIPWHILKKIAFVHPRILLGRDDDGKEIYDGIQRKLSTERKEEIKKYITGGTATFPSSIIINIPKEELRIDTVTLNSQILLNEQQLLENRQLKSLDNLEFEFRNEIFLLIVRYQEGIAQIIDGQHRLSGFENLEDDSIVFDLPVTIFLEQSPYDQAEIFATINGKQTRVTPSLVYDLFGISDKRNPYTVARYIVKSLNEIENSPLRESIKILGKSNEFYNGFVTQSTVSQIIIDLICGNIKQAEVDRRLMQRELEISDEPTETKKKAPLRRYFRNNNDEIILKVLMNFFNAVKETFPIEWNRENSILKKTVGFTALLKILPKLIEMGKEQSDLSQSFFETKFEPSKNMDFSQIQLSSKGVNQLVGRFNILGTEIIDDNF